MAELILDNINKHYHAQSVVNQLSLTIKQGDFVALLGPSGCGKTTTLRMLAGFENPDHGMIRLADKILFSAQKQIALPPEKRQMGMVFQSYALWPHMSVADNVGYPIKLQGIKGSSYHRRVEQALETVQLNDKAKCSPQQLSGGQRQRVALARCLIANPAVVLLDEPLSNLDQHLRASMQRVFKQFHQQTQATFIYVTHDQGEAMALADQIAVLNQGRLEQWGSPEQLYQQPRSQWIAQFIGQGSLLYINQACAGQLLGQQRLTEILSQQAWGNSPIIIRPQHVLLNLTTGIAAQVMACIYRGERYEITVALAAKQQLLAYHTESLTVGSTVFLQISQAWGVSQ